MHSSTIDLNNPETIAFFDELPLWSAPFGQKILDLVHIRQNSSVLDIGSGTGFPLLELAMRIGDSGKLTGLDPWKAANDRTQKKMKAYGITNTKLVEGVAEEMPFKPATFDVIVSNNGLNNVSNLNKSLAECNRVAKPGAQLVFSINTSHSFHEFYNIYRQVLTDTGNSQYLGAVDEHIYERRKPESEIVDALTQNGFKVAQTQHDSFYYRFASSKAMFDHHFVRLAFLQSWLDIIPADIQTVVFNEIKQRIDRYCSMFYEFKTQVPFVVFDCVKV